MKIFLAGMDNIHEKWYNLMCEQRLPKLFGLYSYLYLSKKNHNFRLHSKNFKEVLIDSGAHTFHTSKNVNFLEYAHEYSEWIYKNDKKNISGFFELDVDNRIGYKNVLKCRKILEDKSDKIIPVWHKNRGIKNYVKMCKNYDYVAISCLKIEGIPDNDLHKYIRIAHHYDAKIHGLGGTRKYILDNCDFDTVDSISWMAPVFYNKDNLTTSSYREQYNNIMIYSYLKGVKLQKEYLNKGG